MHVGGNYKDTEKSLERFIDNWMLVPNSIQDMIMLENDDTSPLVFDYHHHLAHHHNPNWEDNWSRILQTWSTSPLPIKMHISSPKDEKHFRHHADYIDIDMFFNFLNLIKGSIPVIDCMIEAKKKDEALFKLIEEVSIRNDVEMIDGSSFRLK